MSNAKERCDDDHAAGAALEEGAGTLVAQDAPGEGEDVSTRLAFLEKNINTEVAHGKAIITLIPKRFPIYN